MNLRAPSFVAFGVCGAIACSPATPPVVDRAPPNASSAPTASSAAPSASSAAPSSGRLVAISPKVSIVLAPPWDSPPPNSRNAVDFARPEAHVLAMAEPRNDHADALRRLAQDTTDYPEPVRYVDVCGWPAFERRARRPLAAPNNAPPPKGTVMTVTIAIAIDDTYVVFSGTVTQGVSDGFADDIATLARSVRCPAAPTGQTDRDLTSLRTPAGGCCEDGLTWQGCCGTPKHGGSHQCGAPGAPCAVACVNQRACGK